jgi:superfamily II DNA or RNA helicase
MAIFLSKSWAGRNVLWGFLKIPLIDFSMDDEQPSIVDRVGGRRIAWRADDALVSFVRERFQQRLSSYSNIPDDVRDHYGSEIEALAGGYSYRQVLELVQNAADAVLEQAEMTEATVSGRIALILSEDRLYAANTGEPINREGIIALLSARSSSKRKSQIGRFGIGFKSLLGLKGRIDVFSRSVSLRFDPDSCAHTIREHLGLPADHPAPGLRLAWILDPEAEFDADPILRDLAQWATTVVRVDIGSPRLVSHIRDELAAFPPEFLLFLPVDVELDLKAFPDISRKLVRRPNVQGVVLAENDQEALWRLVDVRVPLSDTEARADATTVHQRDEVPVAWALPLSAREEKAGRFWAFFPTDTPSRIPGILNAPWKVNSDRTALIHGPYNSFLMNEAANLIVSSLKPLATPDDPGRPLDMFPRELETREEAAQPLVDAVWNLLCTSEIVADANCSLKTPTDIRLHPIDDEGAVQQWRKVALPKMRADFVHPDCHRGQRLNRLKFLFRRRKGKDDPGVDLVDWLEGVASGYPPRVPGVLELVKRVSESGRSFNARDRLRRAKLVPSQDGMIVAAMDAVISDGFVPDGKYAVHRDVVEQKECRDILETILGVKPLDDPQWSTLLNDAIREAERVLLTGDQDIRWQEVWNGIRNAPESVSNAILKSGAERVRVRSLGGKWEPPAQLLRAGSIVPDDPSVKDVLVDHLFHQDDERFLSILRVGPEPRNDLVPWNGNAGSAFMAYLSVVRPRYNQLMQKKRKSPQWGYLNFINGPKVLAGAPLLVTLPKNYRTQLSTLLLDRLDARSLPNVSFGHETRGDVYEPINVPSPTCWLLAYHGAIDLAGRCVTIADLITASAMEWIRGFPGWNDAIEKAGRVRSVFFEGWEIPKGGLESLWPAAFAACESEDVSLEQCRLCYEAAAGQGEVPARVRVRGEVLLLEQCFVTCSDTLSSQAQRARLPVVSLTATAADLWIQRGAKDLASVARIEYDEVAPDPVRILDVAPEIAGYLEEGSRDGAWVQVCQNLRLKIGDVDTPLSATFDAGVFLVDLDHLGRLSWQERLVILVREAINAGWIAGDVERITADIVQRDFLHRRAEVAAKATIEERLLAAVGGNPEALLETFDDAVRRAVELRSAMTPLDVARLALAVHGPTVLSVLRDQLEQEGLNPPRRWGTPDAFAFATALGFPPDFGGSRSARRSAEMWASGPMPLGELHDYQARAIGQLKRLISDHRNHPARAVLSLPTGSGKTRVAVETAVDCTLGTGGAVLWIAQTDELCEQAVQSFRQVWANCGREWTDLRILRYWGGNPNPPSSDEDVPTVIVASIQTLTARMVGSLPDWIRNAGLVVIDEAHHAIAPSYTKLLNWLTGKNVDGPTATPPPLLGLSATPFRGRDEDESRRLARRFNGRLLPAPEEQGDLYKTLQDAGMLSEIVIEPLNYARAFVLTDAEKKQIARFDEFPEDAARRMGEDARRNEIIVRAIKDYAHAGRVLLFANSVWHAGHLAALLQLNGVKAAAVHGGTDTSARQYFIRLFQSGDIKVLCNYGVLTTGFDAPMTDVIVISRPVFSPVRYMQMVGRGLRGEKNGGTATCRVVTVLDNIVEYSNRLAYHKYFTPYFQK